MEFLFPTEVPSFPIAVAGTLIRTEVRPQLLIASHRQEVLGLVECPERARMPLQRWVAIGYRLGIE
jgi:hypothetical protein